ncbi:MAG: carbohydrate-binding protein [Clostridia bacterium]|nr:carbohydrate-binding protein [Clostridia bacterium]
MKRKFSAFLLSLLVIFNVSVANAAQITGWLTLGYWPGETHHTITAEELIATNHATVKGDSVIIDADGSATWGFYLPYGSRSVTINHEGTAHIEMTSGDITYEFDLADVNDGTANLLVFGDNLGRAAQDRAWTPDAYIGYKKEWVEREGEKEITITADSAVTINSLVFEKEKLPGPTPTKIDGIEVDIAVTPDISEYDRKTLSTVLMDTQANIIVVNGGRRYVDNNDTDLLPYQLGGSVYLPINTLAKALGYYYEEDSSRGYALMRSSTHEVVLLDGECTVQEGYGAKVSAPDDVIIYREGRAMAGVRYFAELAGNTVGYRDGLIVIDNKYTVEDILNESAFYSYATAKFSDFKADKTVGNTYYVAQTENASDDNTGSISSPFKTLGEAAERAQAGDTVIVREGVYRETLTPLNSGTATAPITFKAADGEDVVISAADVLAAPEKSDETHISGYDIYVTDLPETLGLGRDQIFINGEMMTQARYPNGPNLLEDGSMSNAWPVKGNMYLFAGRTDTIQSDSLLNQGDGYWDGAMWTGTFGYNYAHVSGVVESSSYGELKLDADYFPHWWWSSWTDRVTTQGSGNSLNYGCLIGHEHALDIPGEWVRTSDNELRIILPEDVSPQTVQIEAKTRQLVVNFNNKEYINVEGFSTIGGSVTMKDSEMCMLNDMDMKYISHYTLSADQRSGYIDFPYDRSNQNGAPQRGEVGLYIDGTDNIIVNSMIDHSAGCALYLTGTYTYVENNVMSDCGYTSSYTSGIHTDTQAWDTASTPRGGYAVYNNTIYNTGRNGIDFCVKEGLDGGSERHTNAVWLPCEIAYNDCHDLAMFTDDGGMIYANGVVMGLDEQMSELHHNYVYTTKAFDNAYNYGIYWDGNAHGCDTYNNLVFSKDENGTISYNAINRHPIPDTGADSSASVWNNMQLGFVGVDASGLSEYHFPEEKMFYAGVMDDERRNMNYARYKSGAADITNKAADAVLSDTDAMSVGSDGFVTYTENGQYVLFEDVDFGTGANEMELYLRGDRNWTLDKLKIYVGKTKDTATVYNTTVSVESYGADETNTHSIVIHDTSGTQNVWVEAVTLSSVRLGGISVWKHENPDCTDEYTLFKFVSARDRETRVSGGFMSYTYGGGGVWPIAYPVNKMISACTATYTDCVVTEPSRYFAMTATASGNDAGQLVKVYIDDETEPICTYTITNTKSGDIRVPNIVPFDNGRVLQPGTYDVKLVFDGYYTTTSGGSDDSDKFEPVEPAADLIFDMDLSGCSAEKIAVADESGSGKVSKITYGNGSTGETPGYAITEQGTPYLIFDTKGNTAAKNGSVNVGLTDKTLLDADELSISAWVYDANSATRQSKHIFGFGTGLSTNVEWSSLLRQVTTGTFLAVRIEGNAANGAGNLGNNQFHIGSWTDAERDAWKHVAITKKWTYTDEETGQGYYTVNTYVDGEKLSSYNNKNTDTDSTRETIRRKYSDDRDIVVLEIGGNGGSDANATFAGYIADFKLYDGLLTDTEVKSEYYTTKDGFYDVEPDSSDETTEEEEVVVTTHHKQSTVNYFGFLKDDDGISDIYVNKHEGGGFSKALSVLDSNKPFYILRGSSELSKKFILAETLPNTTAAYEKVLFVDDSLRFVARYSAEEGCAGQEVTVRVDDPNSEPIATFTTEETGAYRYKTVRVNLEDAIPAGEHTVYISFGGDEGSGKTCRLDWFGFAKKSVTNGE